MGSLAVGGKGWRRHA